MCAHTYVNIVMNDDLVGAQIFNHDWDFWNALLFFLLSVMFINS